MQALAKADAARIREIEAMTGGKIRRTAKTERQAKESGAAQRVRDVAKTGKVVNTMRAGLRELAQSDARQMREMDQIRRELTPKLPGKANRSVQRNLTKPRPETIAENAKTKPERKAITRKGRIARALQRAESNLQRGMAAVDSAQGRKNRKINRASAEAKNLSLWKPGTVEAKKAAATLSRLEKRIKKGKNTWKTAYEARERLRKFDRAISTSIFAPGSRRKVRGPKMPGTIKGNSLTSRRTKARSGMPRMR